MTIAFNNSQGITASQDTTAPYNSTTRSFPGSQDAGDLMLLVCGGKPFGTSYTISDPGGSYSWTLLSRAESGTTGAGNGTGSTWVDARYTISAGGGSGPEVNTVTLDPDDEYTPFMRAGCRITKTAAAWDLASTNGADGDPSGTGVSAAMGSDPGFASGDMVVVCAAFPDDNVSDVTSPALSIPGCTVGSLTQQLSSTGTSAGRDGALFVFTADVTAGTSSGAATFTGTVAGSDSECAVVVVRLRETAGGTTYDADAAPTITAGATASATRTRPLAGSQTVTAGVTASATRTRPLDGTSTTTRGASASVTSTRPLDGTSATTAASSASAERVATVDASQTVTAGATASAEVVKLVDATGTATAASDASATRTRPLDGTGASTAGSAAAVVATRPLDGTSTTTAGATADAERVTYADASSSVTAASAASAEIVKLIDADSTITASATADAEVVISIDADSTITAAATADAERVTEADADSTTTASASADVVSDRPLDADSTITAGATADMERVVEIDATSVITATGNASGSVPAVGQAEYGDSLITENSTGTSHVVDAPSGVTDEYLIAHFVYDGPLTTVTPPSGWTEISQSFATTNPGVWLGYLKLTGASSSTYTFTLAAGRNSTTTVSVIRGVDPTTPLDVAVSEVQSASGQSSVDVPGITPANNNSLLMLFAGANAAATGTKFTVDAPWNEIGEWEGLGTGKAQAAYFLEQDTAAATGDITINYSGTSRITGVLAAFRAAPAGTTLDADATSTITAGSSADVVADRPIDGSSSSNADATADLELVRPLDADSVVVASSTASMDRVVEVDADSTITADSTADAVISDVILIDAVSVVTVSSVASVAGAVWRFTPPTHSAGKAEVGREMVTPRTRWGMRLDRTPTASSVVIEGGIARRRTHPPADADPDLVFLGGHEYELEQDDPRLAVLRQTYGSPWLEPVSV